MRTFAYGALGAIVLASSGFSVAAYAADPAAARLQAAVSAPRKVIIDGRLWSCEGEKCTSGSQGRNQPIARECVRVAKALGPVAEYRQGANVLDAAALVACNVHIETARTGSSAPAVASAR